MNRLPLPSAAACQGLWLYQEPSDQTNTVQLWQNSITGHSGEHNTSCSSSSSRSMQGTEQMKVGSWFLQHDFKWHCRSFPNQVILMVLCYKVQVRVSCILATLTFWIRVFYHHPDFKHTVSASCYQYEGVISQFIHVTKAHVCDVVVMGCVYSGVQCKAIGKESKSLPFYLIWNLGKTSVQADSGMGREKNNQRNL